VDALELPGGTETGCGAAWVAGNLASLSCKLARPIGRQRAYFLIIFQVPQNWVAAERISFKLLSILDVRKQVLFSR
jgi:hypothetical protein